MGFVVFLSLCSAIAYGLSDFVGGLLARKTSAWAVAFASQATATLLILALVWLRVGEHDAASLMWGAVAGLGSGVGNVCIYRGLGTGRMAIVAPVSALAAAALPVFVGVLLGERPAALQQVGVAAALPAIWLVSGGGSQLPAGTRKDVLNGLTAGLGFGIQFAALGQVGLEAGLVPLAVSQVVSVVAIVIGAISASAAWTPVDRFSRLGTIAGVLAGIATICFQFAVQYGLLTIASVLTSLYPAVTVILAATILRERIRTAQSAGLVLAAAAVGLIAAG